MIILENGERADPLWGIDTEIITDEMIEALEQGKRLYLSVNDEYAVVIKKNGKRKTDKPEATDTDTISRKQTLEHLKKRLYESALNNDGIASKIFEEIADNRVQIWVDELPPSPSRPQWIPCSERLPEVTVLCCDTRGEMIIGYPYQDEESNTGYSAVLDDIVMIDCTAWMPLPEPYHRP